MKMAALRASALSAIVAALSKINDHGLDQRGDTVPEDVVPSVRIWCGNREAPHAPRFRPAQAPITRHKH